MSFAVIVKVAEAAPAGMVIKLAAEPASTLLFVMLTVSGLVVGELRLIVPMAVPPFSERLDLETVNDNDGTSSSSTEIESVTVGTPMADAVIFDVFRPDANELSMAETTKVANAEPAGIVIEVGTVTTPVALFARLIVSEDPINVFREIVAVVNPPFSTIVEFARCISMNAVSLSDVETWVTAETRFGELAVMVDD